MLFTTYLPLLKKSEAEKICQTHFHIFDNPASTYPKNWKVRYMLCIILSVPKPWKKSIKIWFISWSVAGHFDIEVFQFYKLFKYPLFANSSFRWWVNMAFKFWNHQKTAILHDCLTSLIKHSYLIMIRQQRY